MRVLAVPLVGLNQLYRYKNIHISGDVDLIYLETLCGRDAVATGEQSSSP